MPIGLQPTGGTAADKIEVVSGAGFSGEFSTTQIDEDNSVPAIVKPVPAVGAVGASATVKVTTDVVANHYALVVGLSLVCITAGSVQFKQTINGGTTRIITPVIPLQIGDKLEYSDNGVWFHYDQTLGVYTALSITLSRTVIASGSGTYTPPPGCRAINVRMLAGGGAGGSSAGAGSSGGAGSGGGSGSYVEKLISPPAASYAYAVGAGGTAGATGNNAGGNGVDTTFGASLTAKGATGGAGSGAAAATALFVAGGAGGVAGSGGDINPAGEAGSPSFRSSATILLSGAGANSVLAGGANGRTTQGDGAAASANSGAGGAGGCSVNAATNQAGGTGGSGIIMIDEMF